MRLPACLATLCLTASGGARHPAAGRGPRRAPTPRPCCCRPRPRSRMPGLPAPTSTLWRTSRARAGDAARRAGHRARRFRRRTVGRPGRAGALPAPRRRLPRRHPGRGRAARRFSVTHTFGIRPLQQVLLPQPGGRLQAFTIAWDTEPQDLVLAPPRGRQRPRQQPALEQPLPNWNLMCGGSHATAYRKGYEQTRHRQAIAPPGRKPNVGCQACHGGGHAIPESARAVAAASQEHAEAEPRTARSPAPTPGQPMRGLPRAPHPAGRGRRRLVPRCSTSSCQNNLRADLYHADGQQPEEVFEYGSYRQSRMYQAGVACTDCHDPHSGTPPCRGQCAMHRVPQRNPGSAHAPWPGGKEL